MKKYKNIIILAAVAVVLVLLVISRLPYKVEKEMTVCSLEGEVRTVKVELVWQRYFTKPSALYGNVYFNDKTYYNQLGYFNDDGEMKSFGDNRARSLFEIFQDIGDKIRSIGSRPYMYTDLKENVEKYWELNFNDKLTIKFPNTDFEIIEIAENIRADGETHSSGIFYFGPAETAEEAHEIMREMNPLPEES